MSNDLRSRNQKGNSGNAGGQQQQSMKGSTMSGGGLDVHQAKEQLSGLMNKACESCATFNRQYPAMTIGLFVLAAFCLGMAAPLLYHRMVPQPHSDAHAALDKVLNQYYDTKGAINGQYDATTSKLKFASDSASDRLKMAGDDVKSALEKAALLKAADYLKEKAGDAKDALSGIPQNIKDTIYPPKKPETLKEKVEDAIHRAAHAVGAA